MKTKFILTVVLLIFSNLVLAQVSYFEKFPFKEVTTIKLVSYSDMDAISKKWKSQGCINMPQLENGNVLDVDFSKMNKIKSISLQQTARLYEIAIEDMNCPEYENSTDCSNVKSGYGILFINAQNEILAIIGFCFECNFWSRFPGGIFEPICPQKLELVSKFFHENGFDN